MFALLFLAACSEFGIDTIGDASAPPRLVAIEDSFDQTPLPKVDLLFVIDDTASMAVEQDHLATDFGVLADSLAEAGVAWQIGVVTTDMANADAGLLRGSPWVLTDSAEDPEGAFADVIVVGTNGKPPEAGIAAATLALELAAPGKPNAGFRRPDAALHVIFVSDADDDSGPGAQRDFLRVLRDDAEASGLTARASAIVGDVPGGCVSPQGSAQAGARYEAVARDSGGITTSICAADFGPLLSSVGEASLTYQTRFELRTLPMEGTLRVQVDGVRQADGWTLEVDPPAVVFDTPPPAGSVIHVTYFVEITP